MSAGRSPESLRPAPPSPTPRTPKTAAVDLDEPLLNAKQAGELLGVPASTVYQWAREGRLPSLRLGPRAIRWERGMLARWASEQLDEGRP